MTEYETKKIIYETIVKEIYINPDTALELTKAIYTNLKAAEKDAPETLIDLPRPWSTDEMKAEILFQDGEPCNHVGCRSHISHPCEGCGRTAARGIKYKNMFITPRPLPYEVYKDFEQGQPFKDEQ